MPRPRAYVETTIPSFYYDFRESPAVVSRRDATRRWWADAADRYELFTSTVVLSELSRGSSESVALRVALLTEVSIVPIVPPVIEITDVYLRHKLMPAKPPEDAWHLALASFHDCDLIVTWNCRHLANPNKAGHIRGINTRLGLSVPRLATPLELLEGEP